MEKSKVKRGPAVRRPFSLNNKQLQSTLLRLGRMNGSLKTLDQTTQPSSYDVTATDFHCPRSFANVYLDSEMLSKLDDGKKSPEKDATTWARFHQAEEMCLHANRRLSKPSFGPNLFTGRSPYSAIMLARQKMEKLLGAFCWNEASLGFGWGPGASTRLSRRRSNAAYKYSGRPETTIGNAALASAAVAAVPLWKESNQWVEGAGYCDIVAGNRIVTVPKSYKTDRTIAIEPCMNMYVQKGIGSAIRRRLRRVGIDLDDQTRNQRLALIGSISGLLATIDLSMASDTVSYEIVRLLLPPDWFDALEQSRSPVGILPSGDVIRYQKFSSMGNGYTFELETAIFYCLALAVHELHGVKDNRISVYGDDIVVPTEMAQPLIEVLEVAGFKPNAKKTFHEGPFRESCGKHYFLGCDVTPFYVKKLPRTLDDLFLLHNQLYRWCSRVGMYSDVSEIREIILTLRSMAPAAWRKPRIPDGFGDGAFIGTFDEATPTVAPHSLEGFLVEHRASITQLSDVQPDTIGRLLSALSRVQTHPRERGIWGWLAAGAIDCMWGDVPSSPRVRTVRSLVPRFTTVDPFTRI